MDQEIDVPSYFVCPISLEIMKDPVTVPTGITYDRDSIERWIYSSKNATCPVTKQPLSVSDMELTPNHTLRRLIQSWCTLNAVDRIPTPKPPVSRAHLTKLFSRALRRHSLTPSLRELKSLALESPANRRALESAGAVRFLSSVIVSNNKSSNDEEEEDEVNASVDLAVSVLSQLHISEADLLAFQNDTVLIDSLTRIIGRSSSEETMELLKNVLEVAQPVQLAGLRPELFSGLIRALKDQVSSKATAAALKVLIHVMPWGRNRVKAVEAGAVGAAVEMLLAGDGGRRVAEMAVVVVEMACGCAEGRAELVGHSGGLAVVSKRVLRVSRVVTERGVRALWAVAKYSGEAAVVREMAEVGVVAKMCLVLQVEVDGKTKERAQEILKLHAAAWKGSPCVPSNLHRSFA